jgi:hypothetical protein
MDGRLGPCFKEQAPSGNVAVEAGDIQWGQAIVREGVYGCAVVEKEPHQSRVVSLGRVVKRSPALEIADVYPSAPCEQHPSRGRVAVPNRQVQRRLPRSVEPDVWRRANMKQRDHSMDVGRIASEMLRVSDVN